MLADVLVDDKVLLELKAISEFTEHCSNWMLNYLKVFNIHVGLLLNFGCGILQSDVCQLITSQRNP